MSDAPPPLPQKPPIGPVFWVVLLLPVALTLVTRLLINGHGDAAMVPLILLVISGLVCPIYCGVRLALRWSTEPAARVLLGIGLCVGIAFFYLAVAFAGCMTAL